MLRFRRRRVTTLDRSQKPVLPRLILAVGLLVMVHTLGTIGFWLLSQMTLAEDARHALLDCAYMTVISVTTVGFGEHIDVHAMPGGTVFTAGLILVGGGIELYVISVLTTFFVEGHLLNIRQMARIRKIVGAMNDHIILCGAGRSGFHIATELVATGSAFVAVDRDKANLDRILALQDEADAPIGVVIGDATDAQTLRDAGLERASKLVVSLDSDQAILYAVMVARGINPDVFVVAKSSDSKTIALLERAGANRVVATKAVSGMRLASETLRPNVVDFLAEMVRDSEHAMRFEEFTVHADSRLDGARVDEFAKEWARRDLAIVAVKRPGEDAFYGPPPEFTLHRDDILIVIADRKTGARMRTLSTS